MFTICIQVFCSKCAKKRVTAVVLKMRRAWLDTYQCHAHNGKKQKKFGRVENHAQLWTVIYEGCVFILHSIFYLYSFLSDFFIIHFFHSLIFFSFLDNHFDLPTTEVDFKVSIIFFCVRYFFQFEFFAFFGSFFLILGGIFRFLWSFFHGFFITVFLFLTTLGYLFFYHVFVDFLLRVFFCFCAFLQISFQNG